LFPTTLSGFIHRVIHIFPRHYDWRKISSLRKSQHDFPQWPFLAKLIFTNKIRHLDAFRRRKIPGGIAVAKRRATQVCSSFRRSVA